MTTAIFNFPLEQIGIILRNLSLSGSAGNIVSIIIFAGIGLLPVILFFILKKKGIAVKVDGMLFLLSAVIFYDLYYSINPGLFETNLTGAGVGSLYLGSLFYSVLVAYGVARIYHMAMKGGKQTLFQLLNVFLIIVAVLFAAAAIMEFAVNLPEAMEKTREAYEATMAFAALVGAEAGVNLNLSMMELIVMMESVMRAVPYILDVVIIFQALMLVKELHKDWYSEASVQASGKFAGVTGRTLVIIAALGVINNLVQLLCRNYVTDTNMVIDIPILSIVFMLAALLAARYIKASQELKTDNDLFI